MNGEPAVALDRAAITVFRNTASLQAARQVNCGVLPYKPMALQSHIPGLGAVTKDDEFGWYCSQPLVIPVLGDQPCRMVVEGYDEDANKDEFHVAIRNFLALDPSVLRQCEEHVYRYYQDRNGDLEPGEAGYTVSPHAHG